jgi:hypothetical protein
VVSKPQCVFVAGTLLCLMRLHASHDGGRQRGQTLHTAALPVPRHSSASEVRGRYVEFVTRLY